MSEEKREAKKDQVKGSINETVGKVTGDKEKEAKGRSEKNTGKVKEALDDAAKSVKGAVDGVKDAFTDDDKDGRR